MKRHRTGYLHKRGDNWYVSWRINGKLHMKALRDDNGQAITARREAEIARDKFMAPLALADEAASLAAIAQKSNTLQAKLESEADALPLSEAWSEYMASTRRPDTGPDTLKVYQYQFARFVDWMREHHPDVRALRSVTSQIAEAYAATLNGGRLAPSTFNKHLAVLSLVFRTLFNKAKLAINPWQGITRKTIKGTVNHHKELTVEELRKVCQSATGEFRTLFGIGTFTGLRLRDCATLLWSEVDMRRNCIMRTPFKTARARSEPVFIPLHPELRAMLDDAPADKRTGYVLPGMAELYLNNKRQLIEKIMNHLEGAGVTTHRTGANGKRILERGFHSLRHSFVSICREAGVPMSTVQEIVGHSSPCMTQVYTHASEAAATRAIASLPSITGEVESLPAKVTPESILTACKAIAESIGPKNWRTQKVALLALLNPLNPISEGGQRAARAAN